jgi:hypothetical protein
MAESMTNEKGERKISPVPAAWQTEAPKSFVPGHFPRITMDPVPLQGVQEH